jgi:hypothetical protein
MNNSKPRLRLAVTVLLATLSYSALGKCLSSPDSNPDCRYPAGDDWCVANGNGNQYAYTEKCLAPARAAASSSNWYQIVKNILTEELRCDVSAESPAEYIETYKASSWKSTVEEKRDSEGSLVAVEVSRPVNGLISSSRTYYRTSTACEEALAERRKVPDEYR